MCKQGELFFGRGEAVGSISIDDDDERLEAT